jgi:hypothetical protein
MDDEGEHIREVFAHFGLALYLAQCLEHGIVNALTQLDLFTVQAAEIRKGPNPPRSREDYFAIFDTYEAEQFEKTMGNLIKRMHDVAQVPAAVAETLRTSKKRRDFLAHRYFRERAVDFTTPHGRDAMLAELKRDHQLFEEADKALTDFLEPLRKVRVTPYKLREADRELIARWHADPSKPKP